MTQKETVLQFLLSLPTNTSVSKADALFESAHPDFNMKNYKFYRREAVNDEVWVPGEEEAEITPISLSKTTEPREFKAVTIDLDKIDPKKFQALKTGTAFDIIASKREGVMRATTYIITGESGAGKTTVATNIADYLKEMNPDLTTGFISAEMDEYDWTEECIDNPRLANLPTIFMLDYLDAPNYIEILTEALMKYDYCIMDSFEVVLDQIKELMGWTTKRAETELINMLRKAAAAGVTIFAIQQYTKGGTFVGSNKIKHMLTGMIFVMFDENGDRYVKFVKNRRGGQMVGKRLYFTKSKETGRIEFDGVRLKNDLAIMEHRNHELAKIQEESDIFDTEIMLRAQEIQKKRNKSEPVAV